MQAGPVAPVVPAPEPVSLVSPPRSRLRTARPGLLSISIVLTQTGVGQAMFFLLPQRLRRRVRLWVPDTMSAQDRTSHPVMVLPVPQRVMAVASRIRIDIWEDVLLSSTSGTSVCSGRLRRTL